MSPAQLVSESPMRRNLGLARSGGSLDSLLGRRCRGPPCPRWAHCIRPGSNACHSPKAAQLPASNAFNSTRSILGRFLPVQKPFPSTINPCFPRGDMLSLIWKLASSLKPSLPAQGRSHKTTHLWFSTSAASLTVDLNECDLDPALLSPSE